jgi:hypothetical protein
VYVPAIGVAAGLAEYGYRDHHVRAVHQPIGHCLLDTEIGAAGVTNSGDSGVQRFHQIPLGRVELVRERLAGQFHAVHSGEHRVDVTVDETRQHGKPSRVDLYVAVKARPDVDDGAVGDG